MARRAHVGPGELDPCDAAEKLAWTPRGFPRWVALDGLTGRRQILGQRRAHGRTIALSGIAAGGLLELLLILNLERAIKANEPSICRTEAGVPLRMRSRASSALML